MDIIGEFSLRQRVYGKEQGRTEHKHITGDKVKIGQISKITVQDNKENTEDGNGYAQHLDKRDSLSR